MKQNYEKYGLEINKNKQNRSLAHGEEEFELVVEDKNIQQRVENKTLLILWWMENETYIIKTHMYILWSRVLPILLYGCQSGVLNGKLKRSREACVMKMFRKVEGAAKVGKISIVNIRKFVNVWGIAENIEQPLRWFGHVNTLEPNRTAVTGSRRKKRRPTYNRTLTLREH